MDPNANYNEQLAIAKELLSDSEDMDSGDIYDFALRLSELVVALHEWLERGGFPPATYDASYGQPES